MKTVRTVTLTTLAIAAFAAGAARAEVARDLLERQKPGYVTEVVVVTATRPAALANAVEAANVEAKTPAGTLAWQEPGYVTEVVVVTASRGDYFDAVKARMERLRELRAATRIERPNPFLGAPQ